MFDVRDLGRRFRPHSARRKQPAQGAGQTLRQLSRLPVARAARVVGRAARSAQPELDAMGCGASANAGPAAAGAESPPQQKYQEQPAEQLAGEKLREPSQTPQQQQSHPSEPSGAQPKASLADAPPSAKPASSAARGPAWGHAPENGGKGQSKTLPERIRTEELIKLCQSSHFDRTQAASICAPSLLLRSPHHTPTRSAHAPAYSVECLWRRLKSCTSFSR